MKHFSLLPTICVTLETYVHTTEPQLFLYHTACPTNICTIKDQPHFLAPFTYLTDGLFFLVLFKGLVSWVTALATHLRELPHTFPFLPLHFSREPVVLIFLSLLLQLNAIYYLDLQAKPFCNKVTSGHTHKVKSFRSNTQNYKNKQLEYTAEILFRDKLVTST